MASGENARVSTCLTLALMIAACGSDTPQQQANVMAAGHVALPTGTAGSVAPTGSGGSAASSTGAAGTAMRAVTAGSTGMPPLASGGSFAAGGSAPNAGASGAAIGGSGGGMLAAVSGGTTGAAGSGAAGTPNAGSSGSASSAAPIGGGFIREDAPTEASAKGKGKFNVKSYTSGFSSQGFGGGTLYYPTDADPPFASVAVVPGFVSPQLSIQSWGPFLASHGIVTMTIDTITGGDLPDQRADELLATLKSIAGENTREGSPLKGKLDTSRQCVSGWSMGGGGTLIAAANNPSLKCAVSFAAWGPAGGNKNKVPALMFEGTLDPLAAGMSEPYYGQVPDSTHKMLFEVNGAGHDVANSPSNSAGTIGMYGLSWFKVYLEEDMRYMQFLTAPKPSITAKFMTNLK